MKKDKAYEQQRHRLRILQAGSALLLVAVVLLPTSAMAGGLHDCMSEAMTTADPDTTIGQLQLQCEKKLAGWSDTSAEKAPPMSVKAAVPVSVVEDRMRQDRKHVLQPFTLMAHKPNYLLVADYNANGNDSELHKAAFDDPNREWKDTEAQFQLSIKFPLLVNLFNDTFDVYGAYTNRSR